MIITDDGKANIDAFPMKKRLTHVHYNLRNDKMISLYKEFELYFDLYKGEKRLDWAFVKSGVLCNGVLLCHIQFWLYRS